MTMAPWQRPTPSAVLGNHERRIRTLERRVPPHQIGWYTFETAGGNPILAGTSNKTMAFTFAGAGAGHRLLDLTTINDQSPTVKAAGMYVFTATFGIARAAGGSSNFASGQSVTLSLTTNNEPPPGNFWAQQSEETVVLDWNVSSLSKTLQIVRWIDPRVEGSAPGPNYLRAFLFDRDTSESINVSGSMSVQRVY